MVRRPRRLRGVKLRISLFPFWSRLFFVIFTPVITWTVIGDRLNRPTSVPHPRPPPAYCQLHSGRVAARAARSDVCNKRLMYLRTVRQWQTSLPKTSGHFARVDRNWFHIIFCCFFVFCSFPETTGKLKKIKRLKRFKHSTNQPQSYIIYNNNNTQFELGRRSNKYLCALDLETCLSLTMKAIFMPFRYQHFYFNYIFILLIQS